jgi:cell division protein ZapB
LDNENIVRQFEELEQKIDALLKACKFYEAENLELKNKSERLEEDLRAKAEAENSYRQEKAMIRTKVDNLLAKINDVDKK